VNNTRADKLDSFMWRYSFAKRRCLMPVTQFAEAEGDAGNKIRTWFALPDEPVFAVAGIWADLPSNRSAHQSATGDAQPAELVRRPISVHEPLRTNMALCGAA
jgi:putative SOS response-associated peptidase YedK